ncbi:phage terminase family protein [Frankia sp. AgPm24]|uniref:phage terminase family protein n=1 Tax=Frankia sp. AgPm24 TaxID=631128 RepID=UPI00200D2600|nr:phage terminase family protein [Frankia sp. AgPm24]MCK9921612.1 phage terminase family protein [Frankia sp. AgPm24]
MVRELVRAPGHDRHRALGVTLAWIEAWCVHGPGDVQGRPLSGPDALPLDDEFAGLILDCYALDENGRRLYDTAVVSRAKGRAKSELAGFIALAEAFAPVRFAGWAEGGERYVWRDWAYEYEPGEPMALPVVHPIIRCLATEETQAGNTYDNIYYNLAEGPLGEDLPTGAAGLTRVFLPDGGEIIPSTASSAAKDGGKESFAVFDEPHLYTLPDLRRMYTTVDRNLRKRRAASPWALLTSTTYQPGEGSTLESLHDRARLTAEGRTREHRMLFDHREAPPDVDLTDRASLRAALAEVYGPFAPALDLDSIIENEFWNLSKDVQDARRYFLNQPTAAVDAWLSRQEWAACAQPEVVVDDSDPLVMFFDGSKTDDATGLVGCRMADGHLVVLGCWEKPQGAAGQDWQVDRADVDRVVRQAFDRRPVVGFFADLAEFESYVDAWATDFRRELLVDGTGGRRRHPVAFDMRGRGSEFTEAVERMHTDVRDRELTHDGDSRLARHVLNARRHPNRWGVSISKESRESPKKIDLAVCAAGARMVRRLVLADPKWERRRRKTGRAAF